MSSSFQIKPVTILTLSLSFLNFVSSQKVHNLRHQLWLQVRDKQGQNAGGGFGGASEPSNPAESMGLAEPGNMKALGGGLLQGGNSLGEGEMLSSANMGSNSFPGTSMKKVS